MAWHPLVIDCFEKTLCDNHVDESVDPSKFQRENSAEVRDLPRDEFAAIFGGDIAACWFVYSGIRSR